MRNNQSTNQCAAQSCSITLTSSETMDFRGKACSKNNSSLERVDSRVQHRWRLRVMGSCCRILTGHFWMTFRPLRNRKMFQFPGVSLLPFPWSVKETEKTRELKNSLFFPFPLQIGEGKKSDPGNEVLNIPTPWRPDDKQSCGMWQRAGSIAFFVWINPFYDVKRRFEKGKSCPAFFVPYYW